MSLFLAAFLSFLTFRVTGDRGCLELVNLTFLFCMGHICHILLKVLNNSVAI